MGRSNPQLLQSGIPQQVSPPRHYLALYPDWTKLIGSALSAGGNVTMVAVRDIAMTALNDNIITAAADTSSSSRTSALVGIQFTVVVPSGGSASYPQSLSDGRTYSGERQPCGRTRNSLPREYPGEFRRRRARAVESNRDIRHRFRGT
jgi:hypothetical protein